MKRDDAENVFRILIRSFRSDDITFPGFQEVFIRLYGYEMGGNDGNDDEWRYFADVYELLVNAEETPSDEERGYGIIDAIAFRGELEALTERLRESQAG
jgi:hypothetical protein